MAMVVVFLNNRHSVCSFVSFSTTPNFFFFSCCCRLSWWTQSFKLFICFGSSWLCVSSDLFSNPMIAILLWFSLLLLLLIPRPLAILCLNSSSLSCSIDGRCRLLLIWPLFAFFFFISQTDRLFCDQTHDWLNTRNFGVCFWSFSAHPFLISFCPQWNCVCWLFLLFLITCWFRKLACSDFRPKIGFTFCFASSPSVCGDDTRFKDGLVTSSSSSSPSCLNEQLIWRRRRSQISWSWPILCPFTNVVRQLGRRQQRQQQQSHLLCHSMAQKKSFSFQFDQLVVEPKACQINAIGTNFIRFVRRCCLLLIVS